MALRATSPGCGAILGLAMVSTLLVGCRDPEPLHPATALPPLAGNDGQIQWRNMLACADCAGIDTQLNLQRTGSLNTYRLSETYLLANGQGARFLERGRWQREIDLLRLQGEGGSLRIYTLLPDGRLQTRDSHGRRLPSRADDFLVPVSASSDP